MNLSSNQFCLCIPEAPQSTYLAKINKLIQYSYAVSFNSADAACDKNEIIYNSVLRMLNTIFHRRLLHYFLKCHFKQSVFRSFLPCKC